MRNPKLSIKQAIIDAGIKPSSKDSARRAIQDILARSVGPLPPEDAFHINRITGASLFGARK
jgi:hypothetical protein